MKERRRPMNISVPPRIREVMDKFEADHPDVNWSAIAQQASITHIAAVRIAELRAKANREREEREYGPCVNTDT